MHLRKTAGQKSEVPFDEPLSTDWNGNELLLSDVWGPTATWWSGPWRRTQTARCWPRPWPPSRPGAGDHHPPLRPGSRREHTQKEVADRMGISQSYISRLEKRIIGRLKKEILKVMEVP